MAEQDINQIRQQIEGVNFPVSKNELVDKVGNKNVTVGGRTMNMRDVINRVPKDRFTSQDELMTELRNNVPEFKR